MSVNLSQARPGEVWLTKNGIEMELIGTHKHKAGTCYVFSSIHSSWAMQTNINGWRLDADGDSYDARCCDIVKKKPEKRTLDVWINVFRDNEKDWEHPHKAAWGSKEAADVNASVSANKQLGPRIACVHVVQEYVEGEGL